MHAISSYRGNRPTNKQRTHPQTHRQDRLQYTVQQLTCTRSVKIQINSEYTNTQDGAVHSSQLSPANIVIHH